MTRHCALCPEKIPDLILCDFKLPGSDGLQTIAALHAVPGLEVVPAILMSGLPAEDLGELIEWIWRLSCNPKAVLS